MKDGIDKKKFANISIERLGNFWILGKLVIHEKTSGFPNFDLENLFCFEKSHMGRASLRLEGPSSRG